MVPFTKPAVPSVDLLAGRVVVAAGVAEEGKAKPNPIAVLPTVLSAPRRAASPGEQQT
jgi:hypothetical protein